MLFFIFLLGAHGSVNPGVSSKDSVVVYRESTEDFPNPERGFYHPMGTSASRYELLSIQKLKDLQKPHKVKGAEYEVACTLVFREFLLDSFVHAPLSVELLENIRKDFQTIRQAGMKTIIRFAYTNRTHAGNCTDEYKICPPYGDAPKNIMLGHIGQLKPVLVENADVIAAVQMGFIGIWGENYFTDYFGDASTNGLGKIMDSSWRDRNEVLRALLNAVPNDRMIQVRTPQIKQRFVYGEKAPVTSLPSTPKEAYDGSDKSRIGFHNDCFLASADDYGTYYDYGNSSSSRTEANDVLRKYTSMDSKFVVVGGETCDDAFSPQNDCEPAGRAEKEFASMHFSYLNTSYNLAVNNDWVTGGCMDNIKRKLGYRFVLRSATFPRSISKGSQLRVQINLENIGYAAPFNPRPVQLILRNMLNGNTIALDFKTDLRYWFTGKIDLKSSFYLPASLLPGRYELLLSLPDKYASLKGRPEYSIRLANEGCWENQTGFNKLNHTVTITGNQ